MGELKRRSERSAQQQWQYAVLGRPVFFIDDDPKADQKAQQSLQELALEQGFKEVQFQFEPIAAALDYEANLQARRNCISGRCRRWYFGFFYRTFIARATFSRLNAKCRYFRLWWCAYWWYGFR